MNDLFSDFFWCFLTIQLTRGVRDHDQGGQFVLVVLFCKKTWKNFVGNAISQTFHQQKMVLALGQGRVHSGAGAIDNPKKLPFLVDLDFTIKVFAFHHINMIFCHENKVNLGRNVLKSEIKILNTNHRNVAVLQFVDDIFFPDDPLFDVRNLHFYPAFFRFIHLGEDKF